MISVQLRQTVRILYAFACGYCGVTEEEVGSQLTVDHYQPKDADGTDDLANLVYACHVCNLHNSTAWNSQSPPVLHPLQTEMHRHIRSLADGTLEPLTAEGTRYIETLHLNRPPMVRRRKTRLLVEAILEREQQGREREIQAQQDIEKKTSCPPQTR